MKAISEESIVSQLISELTPPRLEELMAEHGISPESVPATPLDDRARAQQLEGRRAELVAKLEHDSLLEFASAFELKDFCRTLELPQDGQDAERLRKRIRTHLYFPPPNPSTDNRTHQPVAISEKDPVHPETVSGRIRRQEEEQQANESLNKRRREQARVTGISTAILFAVLTKLLIVGSLTWFLAIAIGGGAGALISRLRLGRARSSFTLGAAFVGAILCAWATNRLVPLSQPSLAILFCSVLITTVLGTGMGIMEEQRDD